MTGETVTARAEQKSFGTPDETRSFDRGTLDLLRVGGADIGLLTLQPGWRWSDHVKPLAGTDLCEAPHFQYHVRGTLHIVMADGTEFDARPGDVTALPQGHDAWVVGRRAGGRRGLVGRQQLRQGLRRRVAAGHGLSMAGRSRRPAIAYSRASGTRAWSHGGQPRTSGPRPSSAFSMARWKVG